MNRFLIAVTVLFLVLCPALVIAQATKQLKERTKDAQEAERKSWQQVDQINSQTDQTNARLQQSRQQANRSVGSAGSTVTTSKVGVASPYRKLSHKKTSPPVNASHRKPRPKDKQRE